MVTASWGLGTTRWTRAKYDNSETIIIDLPVEEVDMEDEYLYNSSHTVSNSSDTYSNLSPFSEANLESLENLFRSFVDENGYPINSYRCKDEEPIPVDSCNDFRIIGIDCASSSSYTTVGYAMCTGEGDDYCTIPPTLNSTTSTTMEKFKPGDKIITNALGEQELPENITNTIKFSGGYCLVTGYRNNSYVSYNVMNKDGTVVSHDHSYKQEDFDLLTPPTLMSSLLEKVSNFFTAEPEKTLNEMGFMKDGKFTDDAKAIWVELQMREDIKAPDSSKLVVLAKELKAEKEKKECCK